MKSQRGSTSPVAPKKKNQKKKAAASAAANDGNNAGDAGSPARSELDRQEQVLLSRLEALVKECPLRPTVPQLLQDVLRLREVVDQLAAVQAQLAAAGATMPISQAPRSPGQNEAALARFEAWFLKHAPEGLCNGAVRFAANTAFGNALKAKRALAQGETFIRVPRKLCLSTDLLRLSGDIQAGQPNKKGGAEQRESAAVGHRANSGPWEGLAGLPKSLLQPLEADPLVRNIPSVALALLLVLEAWRGERGFWAPYIETLPRRSELGLPFLADPRMLARELAGDPATLYEVLKKQRATIIQYAHLRPLSSKAVAANRTMFVASQEDVFGNVGKAKLPRLTWVDWEWAVGTILARQNRVPSLQAARSGAASEATSMALIPGWDLCNFKPGPQTSFWDAQADANECQAMGATKAGEVMFITASGRPNPQLYMYSGFFFDQGDDGKAPLQPHSGIVPLALFHDEFRGKKELSEALAARLALFNAVDPLAPVRNALLRPIGLASRLWHPRDLNSTAAKQEENAGSAGAVGKADEKLSKAQRAKLQAEQQAAFPAQPFYLQLPWPVPLSRAPGGGASLLIHDAPAQDMVASPELAANPNAPKNPTHTLNCLEAAVLLRTLVMTRAEAPALLKQPHLLERPLNPENEAAALELLRLVLRKNLERQPDLAKDAQDANQGQKESQKDEEKPAADAAANDEAKEEQNQNKQQQQNGFDAAAHQRMARRFALAHRRMLEDSLQQLEGLESLNALWELPGSQVQHEEEFQAAVSAAEPRVQVVE